MLACALCPSVAEAQPGGGAPGDSAALAESPDRSVPGEPGDREDPPPPEEPSAPLVSAEARDVFARAVMGFARAIAEMHFYGQVHAGVVTTLVDGQHPGGVGIEASESLLGIGASVALRYERDPLGPTEPVREGVLGSAAFELRPVALARSDWHRLLDPHLSLGFALGAADEQFRAALELGAGIDLGLMPWLEQHPALTLQYRIRPAQ
ncbi:MAG: hypothetical protein JRI23_20880, partial [Deltaproteobacteria bacterium]|nr:hypothetical protein [Deltaproteobacteria bacterium]MBW2534377.1 hypothetical protein [Deltaproteobacteria bacterium]